MDKLPETKKLNNKELNNIKKIIESNTGLKILQIKCIYMPFGTIEYLIKGLTENMKCFNFPSFMDNSEIEDSISEVCKILIEVA